MSFEDYTEALAAKPESAATLISRAGASIEKKAYDAAIADLIAAQRIESSNALIDLRLGDARRLKGELDAAIRDYGDAIGKSYAAEPPERRPAPPDKAWEGSQKEPDLAIKDLSEAIRIAPTNAQGYYERALLWQGKGDSEKALADLDSAAENNPTLVDVYRERGKIWAARKDYAHALTDFIHLVRNAPEDPSGYNGRAWIAATSPDASLRNGKRAVKSATRACELSLWK